MFVEVYERLGQKPIILDARTLVVRAPTGQPLAIAISRDGVIEFEDIRRTEEFNKFLQTTGFDRVESPLLLDDKIKHASQLPKIIG